MLSDPTMVSIKETWAMFFFAFVTVLYFFFAFSLPQLSGQMSEFFGSDLSQPFFILGK